MRAQLAGGNMEGLSVRTVESILLRLRLNIENEKTKRNEVIMSEEVASLEFGITDDPVYHYDMEQNTDEWLQARLGVVTASEINNFITGKGKISKSKGMITYSCLKAAERETKCIETNFQSFDMVRGHIQEEIARDYYSETYEKVDHCGFITRAGGGITLGASPDGLVGNDGGIEIKSRLAKFQFETIVSGEVPGVHQSNPNVPDGVRP